MILGQKLKDFTATCYQETELVVCTDDFEIGVK